MPIDSKHPDYTKQAPAWQMMRDLAGGQRSIHAAAEAYLPRLTEEAGKPYEARLKRTPFYNATWRTIEALVGMLFRKAPKITASQAITLMLTDVTKSGKPIDLFMQECALEEETVGRVGVLTDYPATSTAGMTRGQAENMNIRPHLAMYRAEDIINWSWSWINNRNTLSLVVLEEKAIVGGDQFAPAYEDRWRVLDLFEYVPGLHGYRQRVYRKDKATGNFILVEGSERFPLMNNAPLKEIPFEVFGDGLPPLEDLGHINVSHYQSSADLEHGAHMTALPQPYATGLSDEFDPLTGQKITRTFHIGGGNLWTFADPNSKIGMLEYAGQGLGALENRIASKEQQMAVLGARMLEAQKSGVESAEAAGIHRSGEQSALQAQAQRLSLGFSRVLSWFEQWAGGPGGVVVEVNQDFMPANLSGDQLTALVAAWQNGAISKEALFQKLQKGGVIGDGTDFETEETKIESAPPTLPAATENTNDAEDFA
jgi:hypothetical protein